VPTYDITEGVPYDLAVPSTEATFELTDTAFDIVIDDLPFIVSVNNQNPYRRETAPYKKDQFDNSPEPGEQSLTGWWLRSQTSWHNGSGISFYEPGTDYEHVSYRFADSRGVDVWTIGQATLLPDVFHAYTGADGINAATGNNGTSNCLVSGDSLGVLKRIILNGDSAVNTTGITYSQSGATTTLTGHSTTFPIISVATNGTRYYAACSTCIHTGLVNDLDSDVVFARHGSSTQGMIKYIKGQLFFGDGKTLYLLNNAYTGNGNHSGSNDMAAASSTSKVHINADWNWKDVTAGPTYVYAAGNAGNKSEIYAIGFDETTNLPDMPGGFVVASMPDGENIIAIEYYLGYLAVATNRGVRICQVGPTGLVTLGPLLVDSTYAVNGFATQDKYIYAATKVASGAYTNACLIRIDLSQSFSDGTFAYAYDLEYDSSVDADNSEATEVYLVDNRLVMVVQEDDGTTKGELQVQHTTRKRSTGWLKTGKIRYGTVEPKFFRYINLQCTTGQGDSITVYTIDKSGAESSLAIVSQGLSNKDILISTPATKQEFMSFKFVFNNATDDQALPVLEAYQIKSTPATRRQRLYQYPLSCYDNEMDKFNSIFGYDGRAMEFIQRIEAIEETGKFVKVTDYRTGEQYEGVIEEVRFTNESSPDKNSSGFGGVLLVTVRKM
jgi:hypothetical protein